MNIVTINNRFGYIVITAMARGKAFLFVINLINLFEPDIHCILLILNILVF